MKKIVPALAIALAALPATMVAQNDEPVIMEVAGRPIYQSEFMADFLPTVIRKSDASASEKRKDLLEYVDLYANFRAKVLDAQSMGLDTAEALRNELAKYRNELAAPYLIDSAVMEGLLHEAYERNRYSVHAAHILVRLRPDAPAEDTIKALEHIKELRQRIVDGEDFYAVAQAEMLRQNPNAQKRPNEGDLGYFTAFDMVYPFESAVYGLEVGELSQPFRTRFGYHIAKLFDKVELQGKVSLAHIWLHSTDSNQNRGAINMIYSQLEQGGDFAQLARQSDDRSTANQGGVLADADLSQLPPEYIHVIEKMKPGEYSKPFFTQYGWHIVKLIKKDELPPFEEMVSYYKQRMSRDQRGEASRKSFAQSSRAKYGVVDYTVTPVANVKGAKKKKNAPAEMRASLNELMAQVPDSAMQGKWVMDSARFVDQHPLVHVPGKDYSALDVATYIEQHQKVDDNMTHDAYVHSKYQDFIDSVTIVYADSRLEEEYPEFKALVDEYRRGLMIFNYNEKMIWSKAVKDSAGFADFYQRESKTKSLEQPSDSIYFWNERARVISYSVIDSVALPQTKAIKLLQKMQRKNAGSSEMRDALKKAMGKKAAGREVKVAVEFVERKHQHLLADDQWSRGVYTAPEVGGYRVMVVEEVLPPMLKSQSEARGYYLSEYQNEVERQLNARLRQKYNVHINWDAVNNITY